MIPILATDYGNLGAFVLAVPALLLVLIFLGVCVGFRQRWLQLAAGGIALFVGLNFFISLSEAKPGDVALTKIFGTTALLLSVVCALAACFTRPRLTPPANDECKSPDVARSETGTPTP